ncbi:MAG: hypothetical protein HC858_05590 [Brachymonas sp.]|nr:hypothetical protein [Brachymonas sp.]
MSCRPTLICTEKDAVKLRQAVWTKDLHVLAVPLVLTLAPDFYIALDEKLSSSQTVPNT